MSGSDRDAILDAVRRAARRTARHPGALARPSLPGGWQAFADALRGVGGTPHGPWSEDDLAARLADLVRERARKRPQSARSEPRASEDQGGKRPEGARSERHASGDQETGRVVAAAWLAERLGDGPWEAAATSAPPHSFADVAVALVPGTVASAEGAAVAVEGSLVPERALPFLCERLVLVVPVAAVHPDLHTAWAALPADAAAHHHLTWISGPSKTADIEQTLVYGAHGPLSLDVVGVAES